MKRTGVGGGGGGVDLGVAAALVVDVEGQGVVEHVEVPAAIDKTAVIVQAAVVIVQAERWVTAVSGWHCG